jgi:hypothetical protein
VKRNLRAISFGFLITHRPQSPFRRTDREKRERQQGISMARNKVQFQKGLSEFAFERLYGTEAQCLAQVIAWR